MAEDIREGVDIVFADGKKRTIHPVSLRRLRKLNKVLREVNSESFDISDEDINKMVEAAAIALEDADEKLSKDSERIQDIVDVKTFNTLITAAMGADPNA
jgi:hypothetical protein